MANSVRKEMQEELKNSALNALKREPNGMGESIGLIVHVEELTSDVLKSAMQEFMSGKAQKKGEISKKALAKQSGGKLENIEVSENNIADFRKTASKYDVDFSVKCDKSTTPKTYHVIFNSNKTDNFKRAFAEYAGISQDKIVQRGEFTREQLKQTAEKVSQKQEHKRKEKVRSKENVR